MIVVFKNYMDFTDLKGLCVSEREAVQDGIIIEESIQKESLFVLPHTVQRRIIQGSSLKMEAAF